MSQHTPLEVELIASLEAVAYKLTEMLGKYEPSTSPAEDYADISPELREARRIINKAKVHRDLLFFAEKIDYFGDGLIAREYEPNSQTVRGLVETARELLKRAKGQS